ncbi:MAG: hypothetical protein AAGJ52_05875 [Pseudomonadota bacterium]
MIRPVLNACLVTVPLALCQPARGAAVAEPSRAVTLTYLKAEPGLREDLEPLSEPTGW